MDNWFVCPLCGRTEPLTKHIEELKEEYRKRWGREPVGKLVVLCQDCNGWIFLPDKPEGAANPADWFNPEHIGVMPPWAVPKRDINRVAVEFLARHVQRNS